MQDINTKELDRQESNSAKRLNKETPVFIEKFSGSLGDVSGGCTILINKTIQSIKDPVALGVYCYICSLLSLGLSMQSRLEGISELAGIRLRRS